MPDSTVYRPHQEAPARAHFHIAEPISKYVGIDARRFEFVSRGDFVQGRIYLPDDPPEKKRSTPRALILWIHGAAQSTLSDSMEVAAAWVRQGLIVADIDLPLHGLRASPKLSERLFQGIRTLERGENLDLDTRALVTEFARQSTSDLIRGLDALCDLPEVDSERIGLVGTDIGATLCAYALSHDDRPRVCVLMGGAGRFEDAELDPIALLAARDSKTPCPLLVQAIVGAAGGSGIALEAARAFFTAAAEPKEFIEISADADAKTGIPKAACQHASDFLGRHFSA